MLQTGEFPNKLKFLEVSPIFKKGDKTDKSNYRAVSILPIVSKIYERLLYNQLYNYFEKKLSIFQCGFRKGFSAQHCIIPLLEKWKTSIDNNSSFGALLTDLSKAFDCLSHELMIAKLNAYGIILFKCIYDTFHTFICSGFVTECIIIWVLMGVIRH